MANNKTGFEYYNVDTDRYQDIKIKRLKKDCGATGVAIYDYILCEIYRVRGCFLEWDENTAFDVAEYFGLKESRVNEIVNYCAAVGLFDKELLRCGSVLSSHSIQQRFLEMSARAKRKNIKIPDGINIITEECEIIPEQSPIIPEVCDKVKKSKVNNSLSNTQSREKFPPLDIFEKPILECYNELVSNQSWAETVTMNTRNSGFLDFTLDSFYEYIRKFFTKLQNEGEKKKSPKDAMAHFARWLEIELRKQKDDKRRTTTFSPTTSNPTGKVVCGKIKAGADLQSGRTSQEDYSARF